MGYELPKIGFASLTLDMNVLISDTLSGTLDSTVMPNIFLFYTESNNSIFRRGCSIRSERLLSRVGAALSGVKEFYLESEPLYPE